MPGGAAGLAPNPFGRIPYSRYIGEPGVDGYKLEQFSVGYAFEHRFDNNLQFRSNFRYFDVSQNLAGVRSEGLLPDFRTALRSFNYVNSAAQNIALDNQVQADFATGPLLHKVLVGFDYQRQDSTSNYKFAFIAPDRRVCAGLWRPRTAGQHTCSLHRYRDHGETGRPLCAGSGQARSMDADAHGAAGLGAGGYDQQGLLSRGRAYLQNDKATTGRVGLNYLFDIGLSPYVNYATSFVPTSGTDQSGQLFKPTTGAGPEIGVKFKPVGSNLMLTAAVFELTQQNVLTADPTNVIFSVQTGEVRVRGIELEARGNVTRELEIVGGYSKYDPKVTKSNDGFVGNYLVNTALDQAALWAKYTWLDGPVAGLGIGGGVRYVGESFGDAANTILIPNYTLFDATVSFDFKYLRPDLKGWSAQINATNLTNKYYVASCATALAYCGLGAARTVLGTMKYAWN